MKKYGIVVIGYKNVSGVERLLRALSQAKYPENEILLIISIDYSGNDDVYSFAKNYEWNYGKKEIVQYDKNLGLRDHVIKCGDYLNVYSLDAVVVFEDDMFPSTDFFLYARAATEKYFDDENIAGISLYNREINQTVMKAFYPIYKQGDNYFLQYAQSRGQVWFRKSWNDFRSWYDENKDDEIDDDILPKDVINWPETSWLKYHILYCVKNKKYFVYPYVSHSTCFGEVGEHLKTQTNKWQVYLSSSTNDMFDFVDYNDEAVKYDVFFENEDLYKILGIAKSDLTVDLYGGQTICKTRFLLTIRKLNFPALKSWGSMMKPHELNIIYGIQGDGISLYDFGVDYKRVSINNQEKKGKYVLYGAGNIGALVMNYLGKDNILCFCDSNKSGDVIDEIPIVDIDELEQYADKAVIVISVLNPRFIMEITQILREKGLKALYWQDVVNDAIRKEGEYYNQINTFNNMKYTKSDEYIISTDRYSEAANIDSYFWQDLWAARHIHKKKPINHFDIGSRVDGFIADLLAFGQKVTLIDIRPLDIKVDGLNFVQANATNLENIDDNSIESLSALCSLEHFGLGRYGDPIDPNACFKCFASIQKKVKSGGYIYISVPIGREHLEFNAHRVFSPQTIIDSFDKMSLVEFSSCYNTIIEENINIHKYDEWMEKGGKRFGLFVFRKF